MSKLIFCKGLQGSGKSTWAAQQQGCIIVSKDDIRRRLSVAGWRWSPTAEKEVLKIRDADIIEALEAGYSAISDDTNLAPKHERRLRQLAKEIGAEFEVKDFTDVPLEECIRRDAERPQDERVGEGVIRDTWERYLKPQGILEPYKGNPGLPPAVICDLDGTLALFDGLRGPFEYEKCADDRVNEPVLKLIWLLCHKGGYRVVYLSGREDRARTQTEEFLYKHNCPAGPLFMRTTGDFRKDSVVKLELFDKYVRDVYNVVYVLDDRPQVLRMWRQLGLFTLQVGDGTEF